MQYKRMSLDASPIGRGLLWGGAVPHPESAGYGVVFFAEKAMRGRGESLMGKRCIVTGSGKVIYGFGAVWLAPPASVARSRVCSFPIYSRAPVYTQFGLHV